MASPSLALIDDPCLYLICKYRNPAIADGVEVLLNQHPDLTSCCRNESSELALLLMRRFSFDKSLGISVYR